MATVKELEERQRELEELLAQYGIRPRIPRAEKPEDRGDYIEHGSDEHAQFLGLVEVTGETKKIAFTSPRTGRTFCLEDEVTQFINYPDPRQVAGLVLEQKVNELETRPQVPEGAPPMWRPIDVPA